MLEKPPRIGAETDDPQIGTETCAGDEQEQEGAAINDEQENRSGFVAEKIKDGDGKWRRGEWVWKSA